VWLYSRNVSNVNRDNPVLNDNLWRIVETTGAGYFRKEEL